MAVPQILAVCAPQKKRISFLLEKYSRETCFADSISKALNLVYVKDISIVFYFHKRNSIDAVELLLNIRDIDPEIPVITIGKQIPSVQKFVLQRLKRSMVVPFSNGKDLEEIISFLIESRNERTDKGSESGDSI